LSALKDEVSNSHLSISQKTKKQNTNLQLFTSRLIISQNERSFVWNEISQKVRKDMSNLFLNKNRIVSSL
jgi:hypothetical protein